MPKRTILLSLIALYALCLAAWLSSHNLMVLDEFFAWNLLSDPSFHHALGSWNAGADSGGILYYILLWPLVQLSQGSVLVARLFSAACYLLAAFVWWRALSRFLDPWSAALGVLLVWLSTGLLLVYIAQVRFYTPLLLFAALAVWATLRSSEENLPRPRAALLVFSAHAGLVLIHMLGILYSALIIAASLLCTRPRRRSLLIAAACLASWLTLLPCRTAIRNGSANATSQAIPVLRDVLRFHLKSSASPPVLVIALLGALWLLRDLLSQMRLGQPRRDLAVRGPVLCLAFGAIPFSLYGISHLGRPLGQTRYTLPYSLCLCTLCAHAFARLRTTRSRRLAQAISPACLVLILGLHTRAVKTLPPGPSLELGELQQLAAGKPVVVADEQTFFQLQYYRSNPGLQFHFLLAPAREQPSGIMATVARRGYFPNSFHHVDTFEQTYPEFLFLASLVPGSISWVTRDATCHARQIGSVRISRMQDAVYDVSGCHPPASQKPQS